MAGSAHLPRRRRVLLVAIALFAIVFVLRFIRDEPGDGVTFLYVVPIILLAIEFGRLAGVAGRRRRTAAVRRLVR